MQDCSFSIANALGILQFLAKPSNCHSLDGYYYVWHQGYADKRTMVNSISFPQNSRAFRRTSWRHSQCRPGSGDIQLKYPGTDGLGFSFREGSAIQFPAWLASVISVDYDDRDLSLKYRQSWAQFDKEGSRFSPVATACIRDMGKFRCDLAGSMLNHCEQKWGYQLRC